MSNTSYVLVRSSCRSAKWFDCRKLRHVLDALGYDSKPQSSTEFLNRIRRMQREIRRGHGCEFTTSGPQPSQRVTLRSVVNILQRLQRIAERGHAIKILPES